MCMVDWFIQKEETNSKCQRVQSLLGDLFLWCCGFISFFPGLLKLWVTSLMVDRKKEIIFKHCVLGRRRGCVFLQNHANTKTENLTAWLILNRPKQLKTTNSLILPSWLVALFQQGLQLWLNVLRHFDAALGFVVALPRLGVAFPLWMVCYLQEHWTVGKDKAGTNPLSLGWQMKVICLLVCKIAGHPNDMHLQKRLSSSSIWALQTVNQVTPQLFSLSEHKQWRVKVVGSERYTYYAISLMFNN